MTIVAAVLACGGCSFAPEDVHVSVIMPTETISNQAFVIDTIISNTGRGEQKLLSIDVPDKVLQGMLIERTEPPYVAVRHNAGLNSASYQFNMKLPGGNKQSIKIHAKATQVGDYSGELSFVVNKDWSALGFPIRMLVVAAPAQ